MRDYAYRGLRLLWRLARRISDIEFVLIAQLAVERVVFRLALLLSRSKAPVDRDYALLLTSTGRGNIGDQAMFEAYIERNSGRIVAIIAPRSELTVPAHARDRVKLLARGRIAYGFGPLRLLDLIALVPFFTSAARVAVVGADLMDGGYQVRTSTSAWQFAYFGTLCGVDSRILGFSWKSDVPALVVKVARSAKEAGVKTFLRDRDSFERFTRDVGARNTTQAADMVFTQQAEEPSVDLGEKIARLRQAGRQILIVNTSSLIDERVDLLGDYVTIVSEAHKRGFGVVFVPHVKSITGGDLAVQRRLVARIEGGDAENVVQVERLLTPSQVRWVARQADVVVTGRMHLSILAMRMNTPSVVFSTQDKVSGLMELVGLSGWDVDPHPGCAAEVTELLTSYQEDPERYRAGLSRGVTQAVALAERNFA